MADSAIQARAARTNPVRFSDAGKPEAHPASGFLRIRWTTIAVAVCLLGTIVSFAGAQGVARFWRQSESELEFARQKLRRQTLVGFEEFSHLYSFICLDEDLHQMRLDWSKGAGLRRCMAFFDQVVNSDDALNQPYHADAFFSLGLIHSRLRDFESAQAALFEARDRYGSAAQESVKALDRSRPLACSRLAWLLASQGKYDEAEAAAGEAVQLLRLRLSGSPGESQTLVELAIALRNLGVIRVIGGGDGTAELAAAKDASEQSLVERRADLVANDPEAAADLIRKTSLLIDCCQLQMALLWRHGDLVLAKQTGLRSIELCEWQLEFVHHWSRRGYGMPARRYRLALELARENVAVLSAAATFNSTTTPKVESWGALPDQWQWRQLYSRDGEVVHHEVLARGRLAGEFEPQDGLVISWEDEEWCHAVMPQIARHVHDRLQLVVLVSSNLIEQDVVASLAHAGVNVNRVTLHHLPTDSVWVRDYGPLAITTASGEPKFVEAASSGRYQDEEVPSRLAELFHVPEVPVSLSIDWGGIVCNGAGICLVSTAMLERNLAQGLSAAFVTETLQRLTGAERIVYLDPMQDEPNGHVDVFATFTSANTLVIADCHKTDPMNAKLLDHHAARLQGMPTTTGELQVVRIPMPPRGVEYFGGSYTNVVYANGVLLVPSWPESPPRLEAEALAVYRRLLPDWNIVSIDAQELGHRDGGLHCATMNIHRLGPTSLRAAISPTRN